MGGKKYSAFVTLAVEAEDGRINNTAFTLKLDGIDTPLSTSQAQGVYTFPETEIVGYGVSGNVESFNSGTDPVTIQLIEQGQSEAAYEVQVSGGTQSGNKFTAPYAFSDVPSGTYTMKVMKTKHATREYTITVGTEALIQDVEIWLYGDVNRDGKVDNKDSTQINRYSVNKASIFGSGSEEDKAYRLIVANINNDLKVDNKDSTQINRYSVNKSSIFNTLP